MTAVTKLPSIDHFVLVTDQWTDPFWEAAKRHQLVAMQCADCQAFRMPPSAFCPDCRSQAVNWLELAGDGTIYSYTIVYRAVSAQQADSIPYAPAMVDFADAPGIRLLTNIIEAPVERIAIGAPVRIAWYDRADGVSVPYFRLA